MKIHISDCYRESFSDHCLKFNLDVEAGAQIALIQQKQQLYKKISSAFGFNLDPQEIVKTTNSIKPTSGEFWSFTEDSIKHNITHAFELLRDISKHANPQDFSSLNVDRNTLFRLTKELGDSIDHMEVNVSAAWGETIFFSIEHSSADALDMTYDIQLTASLLELNKFLLRLTHYSEDGKEYIFVAPNELEMLNNSFLVDRFVFAAYLLGEAELHTPEFDYSASISIDSERGSHLAFDFIIFHEIAHYLLEKIGVSVASGDELEDMCDAYAATLLVIGMRSKIVDDEYTLNGIVALFYLLYIKDVFLKNAYNIASKDHPCPKKRAEIVSGHLGRGFFSMDEYDFGFRWFAVDAALTEYAYMLAMSRAKTLCKYQGANFFATCSPSGNLYVVDKCNKITILHGTHNMSRL